MEKHEISANYDLVELDHSADIYSDEETDSYHIKMAEKFKTMIAFSKNLNALNNNLNAAVESCNDAIKINPCNGSYYAMLVEIRLTYIYKLNILNPADNMRIKQYKKVIKELKQAEKYTGIEVIQAHLLFIEAYKELKKYKVALNRCESAINFIDSKIDKNTPKNKKNLAKIYLQLGLIYAEKVLSPDTNKLTNEKLEEAAGLAIESFLLCLKTDFAVGHEFLYMKLLEVIKKYNGNIKFVIGELNKLIDLKFLYRNEKKYNLLRFYKSQMHLLNFDVLNFFIDNSYVKKTFYIEKSKQYTNGILSVNFYAGFYNKLGVELLASNNKVLTSGDAPEFSKMVDHFRNLKKDILQYEKAAVHSEKFKFFLKRKVKTFISLTSIDLRKFSQKFVINENELVEYLDAMAKVRAAETVIIDNFSSKSSFFEKSNSIEVVDEQSDEVVTEGYYSDIDELYDEKLSNQSTSIKSRFFQDAYDSEAEVNDLADKLNQSFDNIYKAPKNYK